MPAGVIDVRAQVFCDLGPVISGQLSDDPVAPGVGLLRTQGEVVINGLIQPARGTEIKLGVRLPDGKLTRLPRRLRVIKADSDPINNETTLTVGCLLTLKWDFVQPAVFAAANNPPWSNVDTAAGSSPIVSLLSNVLAFCLSNCSITQATGNPAVTGIKATDRVDVSNGYLDIASTIIAEAGMYGFIDADEKLRLRKVLVPRSKGPLLTVNDTITNETIGNPSPPERITISFGQAVLPTVEGNPNYKPKTPSDKPYNWNDDGSSNNNNNNSLLQGWTLQQTVSPAETFAVEYRIKVGEVYQTKSDQLSFASVSEVLTQYQTLTYTDKDGIEQSQDVVATTISTTLTCVGAANPTRWKSKLEAGSPAFPGEALIKRTETFNKYIITEDGPIEAETTTYEYEPRIAFAGGLAIENYKNIDLGVGIVLVRKTIVEKQQDKEADLSLQFTTVYQAWGATAGGKTASSVIMNGLKRADDATRISGTYTLVDRMTALVCNGTEKTINIGRGTAPALPSKLRQQNSRLNNVQNDLNTNGGWDQSNSKDSERKGEKSKSQIITLLYGSDWTLKTEKYEMQYCPDSYIAPSIGTGDNGTDLKYFHVPSKDFAYFYGKVIYSILSGMAHGKSITTELRNLPSEPMGTIYLETAGTVGRFKANGTTFAWDAQGLIAGCDAMLDGGAGRLAGASGVDWFPLQVPAANLQTVTPAVNGSPALANTIATPSGFDPAAPGSVWASLGTAGVESDVYAAELTVANVVDAVAETVQRESVSRSLTWLLSVPYDATPVTVSLVSVAVSYGTFTAFTATTATGVSWVTSVTLFVPGVRTDGKGFNGGVAWVTPSTTFTPGGITNSPNNGLALVTPSTTFTPGLRFNGVGVNLGVQWVTSSTTFTPGNTGDPYFSNVALLLHMDGTNGSTTIQDSSSNARTTSSVSGALATGTKKFGTASFTGGSAEWTTAYTSPINSAYTIEAWLYRSSSSNAESYIFRFGDETNQRVYIYYKANNKLEYEQFSIGARFTSSSAVPLDAWFHLAIVRTSGANTLIFINGVQVGSITNEPFGNNNKFVVYAPDSNHYMDEVRLTTYDRYTANFTPPTGPFQNS